MGKGGQKNAFFLETLVNRKGITNPMIYGEKV